MKNYEFEYRGKTRSKFFWNFTSTKISTKRTEWIVFSPKHTRAIASKKGLIETLTEGSEAMNFEKKEFEEREISKIFAHIVKFF